MAPPQTPEPLAWEVSPGPGTLLGTLSRLLFLPAQGFAAPARGGPALWVGFAAVMLMLGWVGQELGLALGVAQAAPGADLPRRLLATVGWRLLFLAVAPWLLAKALAWLRAPGAGYMADLRLTCYSYYTALALLIPQYGQLVSLLWLVFVLSWAVAAGHGIGRLKAFGAVLAAMLAYMVLLVAAGLLYFSLFGGPAPAQGA